MKLLLFVLAAPLLSWAHIQHDDPTYFNFAASNPQTVSAPAPSQTSPAAVVPATASASPALAISQPLNITYQPARCGPWYGNAPCPSDAQNRQLFCSQWGYCGWEFQPQEQAGRFLDPDLVCTTDNDCGSAVANSGLMGVTCSPAEHKCLISLNTPTATSAPTKTVSGSSTTSPAGFMLFLLMALAVLI